MHRIGGQVEAILRRIRDQYDVDPERQARERERLAAESRRREGPVLDEGHLLRAAVPKDEWPWILGQRECVRTHALEALAGLEEAGHTTIVLMGPKDSGRTGAGAWWVAQVEGGLFVHAEQLIDHWLHGRAALWKASRLFLDDLGQEGGSVEQQAIIRLAIDSLYKVRAADRRPTAASTNHTSSKSFAAYLGDRWDRFRERLLQHGGKHPGELVPGFCPCPPEGLRATQRRAKALEIRDEQRRTDVKR